MPGETDYPGIDYGLGKTNVNRETGIRFGIISMNQLNEWAWEGFEADYGDPHCPKCGGTVADSEYLDDDNDAQGDKDWWCEACDKSYWSQDVYGDEPIGHTMDDGEYKAQVDSDNDVWVFKSPYYTHAQFCSPCAPGAGHLAHPCESGPKTYCLGHDWFEGGAAPYPVFRVDSDQPVPPPEEP
jgi:hypothetical protein